MQKRSQTHIGIRVIVGVLTAIFIAPGFQAQSLPSIQPTSLPTNNAMPAPIAGTSNPSLQGSSTPHPAQVTLFDNQIDVRANDSSLNQILRSISRKTGLKITGGVRDERVFGNYGPAPISSVLATLLDGTGTNILFLAGDANTPPQLVLTPRSGGPTPPSPTSSTYSTYDDQNAPIPQPAQSIPTQNEPNSKAPPPTPPSGPPSVPQPLNNVNGSPSNTSPTASTMPTTHSVSLDSVPAPSTTPPTSGIVDAPNPPAPGSTTGTTPNPTLTPEQVYQELLKKQQQPASTPPTPPQH